MNLTAKLNNDYDSATSQGHKIWYLSPTLTFIDERDIKTSTANICRFNGHIDWKLIQHLALCTMLASHHVCQDFYWCEADGFLQMIVIEDDSALLVAQCAAHDFPEAYIGDIVTGLKQYLYDYKKIEYLWEEHVLGAFNLQIPESTVKQFVKYIDLRALCLEMHGGGHMAYSRICQNYGTPSEQEFQIYEFVKELSLESCWRIVIDAINENRRASGEIRS